MYSIIIFCKTLLKGGAEKQALTLSKLLNEKKINIILIIWHGDKIDSVNLEYIKNNSLKYISLRGNPIIKMIQLLRIIKKENISIILSYLTLANFICGLCSLFNRKLITIGGIRSEKLPFYKFIFEMLVHNYLNDATVFNNFSAQKKFEKRGFLSKKIYVIHNAIYVPSLKKKDSTSDDIKIISVSRFVKSKDFQTAFYSFKKLKENNKKKKLTYYFVGYGPLENKMRIMINQLNLNHEIIIIINPSNIFDILRTCDIYLSTSLFEGLSNSIMEAMAVGLPIIATNVGDNRYLIKDTINGFIVPCKDINLITEKLEYLTNSEKIRLEYGENSNLLIRKEYSEEKLLDNYLKLFSQLT